MSESILNPWAVDCMDKFLYFFCPEPGNLFRGIVNCSGAARSVVQVHYIEGCGPQFQLQFFFISTQKHKKGL